MKYLKFTYFLIPSGNIFVVYKESSNKPLSKLTFIRICLKRKHFFTKVKSL